MTQTQRRRLLTALGAILLSLSAAGCGTAASPTTDNSLGKPLTGVKASGTPGQKPKVTIDTPLTITKQAYAVLQEGKGATVTAGERVCVQTIIYNARTGAQISSTWEGKPDCSIVLTSSANFPSSMVNIFKGKRVGSTVALGMPGQSKASSGTTATADDPYVGVLTILSASHDLSRATGQKVSDLPAGLPQVSLSKAGVPSLSIPKDFKPTGSLVAQTLIKGNGQPVTADSSLSVHYSGWLLNGSQFDSSWKKGRPFQIGTLSTDVIKGWGQGLTGQTVGSQVLLIVPPTLGYGNHALGKIPADSTLVFVVDILGTA